MKVIGFSGRLGSGKTELAVICEKYGYERIFFAKPLKQLIARLIDVNENDVNSLKGVESAYEFSDGKLQMLSEDTGVPLMAVEGAMKGRTFRTVRELLQVIGTDLIRKYNANWHVNKIRKMLVPSKNYVFDDVRFKNELDLVRELGGICWFVIRPKIDNISNHESETSLTWRDFGNKIIVNDSCLEMFKAKWDTFMSCYDESVSVREKYMNSDEITSKIFADVKEPFGMLDIMNISPYFFSYKERKFDCSNIDSVTCDSDNVVTIKYKNGLYEIVDNVFNIEDLKICL